MKCVSFFHALVRCGGALIVCKFPQLETKPILTKKFERPKFIMTKVVYIDPLLILKAN